MPKYFDPNSKSATLIGSVVGSIANQDAYASRFPGGVFKGDALSNRRPGAFLVASKEGFMEDPVYTSKNRIEIRSLQVAAYAEAASDAFALGEWLRPLIFSPRFYAIECASVIGILQADFSLEESTEFAPKGGDRLHAATYALKVWISFHAPNPS